MTAAGVMLTSLTPNCRSSTIVMRTMRHQRYQRQHLTMLHSLAQMNCLSIFALNLCSVHQVKAFMRRQKLRQRASLERLEQQGKLNENQKANLARLRA